MDQKEIDLIKHQSTNSVIFLSLRNFGLQAVSVVGFFLLTLILGPSEVGLFAIVAESVSLLGYFSDLGLAAALIQQPQKPTTQELRTTFFVQQLLVLLSIVGVSLFYSQIHLNRSYGSKELAIFIALCLSFFISSLKTIPSILLERKLNYRLISTIDIIENVIFYLLAVVLAFFGFGTYSYVISVIVRSFLGLLIIYFYSSWEIGLSFSLPAIKKLFRFGIPFQLNTFIAMAKDRLSSLLVAGIIGRESFGLLSWAQKGPRLPLGLMDAVMRVTFPAYSRLQKNLPLLANSIKKTTYYISFFVFPMLAGITLIAPDIVDLIPKYQKWKAAIFPLYFYAASYAFAAVTTPITNAFNAVGKITLTTKYMILWTILTWLLFPLLSYRFGYQGTALAALLVSTSSILVWFSAFHLFRVNIFVTIFHPTLSTLIMILAITLLAPPLIPKILLSIAIYLLYHLFFSRSEIDWFIKQVKCQFVKN